MKKATVYLEDLDAERLSDLVASTGRPQSELIRQAVRLLIMDARARLFLSSGAGSGEVGDRHWTSDELYAKVMGLDKPAL